MTTKPSFFSKASGYLPIIFFTCHIALGSLVLLSAPVLLTTVIALVLLLFYLVGLLVGSTYLVNLVLLALKEILTKSLDKDSKEAVALCLGATVITIILFKIFGW